MDGRQAARQQRLAFLPLPQGHGSFRPTCRHGLIAGWPGRFSGNGASRWAGTLSSSSSLAKPSSSSIDPVFERFDHVVDVAEMDLLEALDVFRCSLRAFQVFDELMTLEDFGRNRPPRSHAAMTAGSNSRKPNRAMACSQPYQVTS